LLAERLGTPEHIRDFLLSWYQLGVITDEEHQLLNERGCRHTMPSAWTGAPRFARYIYVCIDRSRGRRMLDDSLI
jgi:hypothetical protein